MTLDEANELSKDAKGPIYDHYGHFKALCERIAEKNMPGRVLEYQGWSINGTERLYGPCSLLGK